MSLFIQVVPVRRNSLYNVFKKSIISFLRAPQAMTFPSTVQMYWAVSLISKYEHWNFSTNVHFTGTGT